MKVNEETKEVEVQYIEKMTYENNEKNNKMILPAVVGKIKDGESDPTSELVIKIDNRNESLNSSSLKIEEALS